MLRMADLHGANLRGANLDGADLSGAILLEADLSNANLTGVKITYRQLEKVKSLKGATKPDGSIHSKSAIALYSLMGKNI
jgi:uncharacterized protein YjbI with pentapeptide repeats